VALESTFPTFRGSAKPSQLPARSGRKPAPTSEPDI
jgi:hypothetical protein